jgi:hypothetical protein
LRILFYFVTCIPNSIIVTYNTKHLTQHNLNSLNYFVLVITFEQFITRMEYIQHLISILNWIAQSFSWNKLSFISNYTWNHFLIIFNNPGLIHQQLIIYIDIMYAQIERVSSKIVKSVDIYACFFVANNLILPNVIDFAFRQFTINESLNSFNTRRSQHILELWFRRQIVDYA